MKKGKGRSWRKGGGGKEVDRIGTKERFKISNGLRVGTVILCRAPEDKATGYVDETVKKFTGRKAR